jgi:hypothetical protein
MCLLCLAGCGLAAGAWRQAGRALLDCWLPLAWLARCSMPCWCGGAWTYVMCLLCCLASCLLSG